jgi:hypothetical protein
VAGIARRRQIYEAAASEATMEQAVPLALYKASVLGPLRKVLAEGKQVIVSQHNHFVRLEAIDDREIVIDDPGWRTRKNQRLTWAEARAIGLFLRYMVVG